MSVTYVSGDILAAEVEALVVPVNCVGVMGAGLARAVRREWPEVFKAYRLACRSGLVRVGSVTVFQMVGGWPWWVVALPTKDHWRQPSTLGFVEAGLAALRIEVADMGHGSVAVPALGCGLGGLRWADVCPLIEGALGDLDGVEVAVYEPL